MLIAMDDSIDRLIELPELPSKAGRDSRFPCGTPGDDTPTIRDCDQLSPPEQYYVYMTGELAAMEISSANVYEYDELPWEFYRDFATQSFDEARHADANRLQIVEMGADFATLSATNLYYDGFIGLSLTARIVALALAGEAFALDDQLQRGREALEDGDVNMARTTERIMHEELRHVRVGLRWARFLAKLLEEDLDTLIEKGEVEANAHIVKLFKPKDPPPENPKPTRRRAPISRSLRRRAGFTDKQINALSKRIGREIDDAPPYIEVTRS
ncbi:DUF455 family protein [Bradyrhizobium sp. UFLA05-153]